MKNRLTVVTSTHHTPSDRLGIKGYRPNTNTELLEYVWEKLCTKIDSDVRWIIGLDFDKWNEKDVIEYRDSILKLKEKIPNIDLYQNRGWRENMIYGKNQVRTPYFLFWEHDWIFTENADFSSMNEILDIMDSSPTVNYIRFNKRANVKIYADSYYYNPKTLGNKQFVQTTGWSNNPHLCRTSFWNEIAYDAILKDEQVNPKHLSTEHTLLNAATDDTLKNNSDWGIYLYGGDNHPQTVEHLDGNKWEKK